MISLRSSPRIRRLLLIGVIQLLTFACLFGAAEIGVRIRQRKKTGGLWRIEETYTIDTKTGLRIPIPGGHFGGIHINSLGFRGPEIAVPKPPSTLRVAFLGSSTTYCAEVSDDKNAWPHLVAEELQGDWTSVNVDYVNGGVPGYTVRSTLRNLESRVAPMEPDIIVIYEGYNDMSGNTLDSAIKQGIASRPTEQSLTWPSKYSLLWYLVEKNLLVLEHERVAAKPEGKLIYEESSLVAPFRRDLSELVDASKRVARLVAVVRLSPQIRKEQNPEQQVHAAESSLYYMPFISIQDLVRMYDDYNDTISQIASEHGVLLISDEYSIPGTSEYYADSVHFADKGSHLMAQRVSRALLKSNEVQKIVANRSTEKGQSVDDR